MTHQDKKKRLTFSYDDGVTQDKRLVKIFNRYGLKATFNINSELLGTPGYFRRENMWIGHNKIESEEAAPPMMSGRDDIFYGTNREVLL